MASWGRNCAFSIRIISPERREASAALRRVPLVLDGALEGVYPRPVHACQVVDAVAEGQHVAGSLGAVVVAVTRW